MAQWPDRTCLPPMAPGVGLQTLVIFVSLCVGFRCSSKVLIIFSYLWNSSGELRPVLKYFFECLRTNFGYLCCSLHWYYVVCASVCTWTALLRAIFSTQRNHGNNWMVTAKEKGLFYNVKKQLRSLFYSVVNSVADCFRRCQTVFQKIWFKIYPYWVKVTQIFLLKKTASATETSCNKASDNTSHF